MQETCNEAVHIEPRSSAFVPDPNKAEEMCNEAVCRDAYTLDYIPDHFRTQERCNEAMCKNPVALFMFLTFLKHKKCVSRLFR